MAQDAPSQQAGDQGDAQQQDRRDRRRSAWAFFLLVVVVLIVLLLLWMYWRPRTSSESTTQGSFTAVVIPPAPANPNVPAPSALPSEAPTGPVVPNVVGDPESSARRALEAASFSVAVSRRASTAKPPGIVFAQTPPAGTSVDAGTVVAIAVSSGSAAVGNTTMPDVIGMTESQASDRVKAAGLVPYVTYGNSPLKAGKVISQWPLGGATTPLGGQGMIQIGINP